MPATQEKDCDILGYDSVYWCSCGTCVQIYSDPEDKGSMFLWNTGTDYKRSHSRYSLSRELYISLQEKFSMDMCSAWQTE